MRYEELTNYIIWVNNIINCKHFHVKFNKMKIILSWACLSTSMQITAPISTEKN
jgi:hypothetical protein